MTNKKMLPIGIEFFDTMIRKDYYYIDKTGLIVDLLRNQAGVTLFTRPRRFGKSLNMSMLENFFSIEKDQSIFAGLRVSEEKALCEQYMGKYPVISVSLKGIQADSFEDARALAVGVICQEARKHYCLFDSPELAPSDHEAYRNLLRQDMDNYTLHRGLLVLSQLLERHYGRKVILLIDEYDVPLAKAHAYGYYDPMVKLIRNLFEYGLKTNSSLEMAVLTGCMRISKESIFTGLNNLCVLSVSSDEFGGYFGFTDEEVRRMLEYYGLMDHYETIRGWYDGYRFGDTDVYCPWDVMNYVRALRANPNAFPENFWINTSGNDAVRRFIRSSGDQATKREIEALVAGETIEKEIHQELTYGDMYDTIDNLWSVLYTTGYLTHRDRITGTRFRLAIPNYEVRSIYTTQIMDLFKENVRKDGTTALGFCDALYEGDAKEAEKILGRYLRTTISIRDVAVREPYKENFYHGVVLGILSVKESWACFSNRESGEGYSDILIEPVDLDLGMVIELKYPQNGDLDAACEEALDQIEEKNYIAELEDEGYERILKYAIACYKKRCRVKVRE